MCRSTTYVTVCYSCSKKVDEASEKLWCSEAKKRNIFGRCARGVRKTREELQGTECHSCKMRREDELTARPMRDIVQRRLGGGHRHHAGSNRNESDDDGVYGW